MWFTLFLVLLLVGGILWIRQRRRLVDRRSYCRESLLSGGFQNDKAEIDIDDALSFPARKKTGIKIENANGIWGKASSSNHVCNIAILYLMAPPEYSYNGYELFQALLAASFRYGEKNIFHRHEMKTTQGQILFSLASVNKLGIFELSKMGSFSCPDLLLFLLLKHVLDSMTAFDSM